jgi:hypothetical protein
VIALSWILFDIRTLWDQYRDVVALSGFVVVIALALWFLRSVLELQPDPFFLNVTFFAFAAQCIRTIEAWQTGRTNAGVWTFFAAALVLLGLELAVMRKHERLTISHYEEKLAAANREVIANAKDEGTKRPMKVGEIYRWAKLMVKISGTDFLPGSLWLLAKLFEGEPKEKSKEEAVSILPETEFNQTSKYLTSEELTVSDSELRLFGFLYVLFPCLSWAVFVGALFASR